jgi:hypothetical protein
VNDLRTVVVMDYQNVHLVGHHLYASTRHQPKHQSLVDPLLFAQHLLRVRNAAQQAGMPAAVLRAVEVFRGQPIPEHDADGYARSLVQKAHWERDHRVTVTLRPLKYEYQRDGRGDHVTDASGSRVVVGTPREKGIDVLCALSAIRAAQDPAVDLVILASSDTDLAPVIDEIRRLGTAKVETFCWWDEQNGFGYQIRPADRARPVWNTRLTERSFRACRDHTPYR